MTIYAPDSIALAYRRGNCNLLDQATDPGTAGLTYLQWPSYCWSADGAYLFALQISDTGNDLFAHAVAADGTITLGSGTLALSGGHATNLANVNLILDSTGDYLFVADGATTLYSIDVSDPTSMSEADTLTIQAGGGYTTLYRVSSTLYAYCSSATKLEKIDVTTPTAITLTSTSSALSAGGTAITAGSLTPDNSYIYLSPTTAGEDMVVWDITGAPAEGTAITMPRVADASLFPYLRVAGAPVFVDSDYGIMVGYYTDSDSGKNRYLWFVLDSTQLYEGGAADWSAPEVYCDGYIASLAGGFVTLNDAYGWADVAGYPEHASAFEYANGHIHAFVYSDENAMAGRVATWEVNITGRHLIIPGSSVTLILPYMRLVSSVQVAGTYSSGPILRNTNGLLATIGTSIGAGEGLDEAPYVVVSTFQEPQGWTDLSADLLKSPTPSLSYGLPGSEPEDRLADTGTFTFDLDNGSLASNGVGSYSPDHANNVGDFRTGQEVRLTITYSTNPWYWYGFISSIQPTTGTNLEQRVTVTCTDVMEGAANGRTKNLRILTDVRAFAAHFALMERMKPHPRSVKVVFGSSDQSDDDLYPYVFDQAKGQEVSLASEWQSILKSNRAFVYVQQGILTYETRLIRQQNLTPSTTLSDTKVSSLQVSYDSSSTVTRANASVYPRAVDSSNVTLFTLSDTDHQIAAGAEYTFDASYADPNQAATSVGALSIVSPVAGTDYNFYKKAGASGALINSALTVGVVKGATSAKVIIKNNGPVDGFLNTFQLRGKGLYAYDAIVSTKENAVGLATHGLSEKSYDMPYQTDPAVGEDAAAYLIYVYGTERAFVDSLSMKLNHDATIFSDFIQGNALYIGDLVTVSDTQTGISADYFVNSVSLDLENDDLIQATFGLSPQLAELGWILEDATNGLLGQTTVLGSGFLS